MWVCECVFWRMRPLVSTLLTLLMPTIRSFKPRVSTPRFEKNAVTPVSHAPIARATWRHRRVRVRPCAFRRVMFRGAFAVNESLWCAWRACLQNILIQRSSCACHAPSRSLSACTAERRMHALAAAKQAELDAVCCLCLCVTVCADL